MKRMLALLVVAVMATMALAVPTPTKTISKRSFAAKVKGHRKLTPKEAMERAVSKYPGLEINVPESALEARRWDPEDLGDGFSANSGSDFSWPSSLPWPIPSESAIVIWLQPSSSALASASASGFAIPSGFSALPSSSGAVPSGFSIAPSRALPSGSGVVPSGFSIAPSSALPSSVIASSGAPPVQSSAPPVQSSAQAPSSSASPGTGNKTGDVSANPGDGNDSFYLSPVTIGNQKLNLDFDTGSSDLWVFGPQAAANGHTSFNPAQSSTWTVYQGGSWKIQYGDGSTASGTVGFDKVNIGGAVVQKQCVELADRVATTFLQQANTDGLLGLAFSTINQVQPQPQKTFFENIMGSLEQPLFTADLEENNSGTYEFGTIDSTKFQGQIQYTAVQNSAGFWGVASKSYAVGGTQHTCQTCSPTIMDTGTSLLLMDADVVKNYYSQVSGAQFSSVNGGYEFPCGTSLPSFAVAIGSYMATIPGSGMNFAPSGNNDGMCFGGLQSSAGVGMNILGDVLFKQFFTVFNGGSLQFGIAPKA